MKKQIKIMVVALATIFLTSCGSIVEPNHGGVLMQNYGKNGKSDYTEVYGRVSAWGMGTKLFQVPLWQQRAGVEDTLHLQDAQNNEMSCFPKYAYRIAKGRLVDVVFDNSNVADENGGNGQAFLKSVEDNVLESAIYDIIKEQSRKHLSDSLMNNQGSLKFEKECEALISKMFESKGFILEAITIQLSYSKNIREKLDKRLEVNTNVSVIDQQIMEQKKKNELQKLITEQALIESQALTPQILEKMWIQKWDGKTYMGWNNLPITAMNAFNTKK